MSFVFFDVTTPSSLFRWETVQSVGMEDGSVLSFVRRLPNKLCNFLYFRMTIKLVLTSLFSNVTTPSSLFRYETIQSVGMGNGSAYLFRSNNTEFSVGLEHG